jgi:hypothetical protein
MHLRRQWLKFIFSNLYRRFGTTYRSHLQGSRSSRWKLGFLLGLLDPWRRDRWVLPKRPYKTTTKRCVISQKSTILIYIAAVTWNHLYTVCFLRACYMSCSTIILALVTKNIVVSERYIYKLVLMLLSLLTCQCISFKSKYYPQQFVLWYSHCEET